MQAIKNSCGLAEPRLSAPIRRRQALLPRFVHDDLARQPLTVRSNHGDSEEHRDEEPPEPIPGHRVSSRRPLGRVTARPSLPRQKDCDLLSRVVSHGEVHPSVHVEVPSCKAPGAPVDLEASQHRRNTSR